MDESGVPRSAIWVTTKLWPNGRNRSEVVNALDASLARLKLTYVDLYLIHSPNDKSMRMQQWIGMQGKYSSTTIYLCDYRS
jgi:diketogulonate reductase-like aldo/keto reductase